MNDYEVLYKDLHLYFQTTSYSDWWFHSLWFERREGLLLPIAYSKKEQKENQVF